MPSICQMREGDEVTLHSCVKDKIIPSQVTAFIQKSNLGSYLPWKLANLNVAWALEFLNWRAVLCGRGIRIWSFQGLRKPDRRKEEQP